jgi:hypothetical protein
MPINFDGVAKHYKEAAARALDTLAPAITRELQATTAHGDDTGAARASYGARRVGMGATGAGELAQQVAAGEALNPGKTGTGSVEVAGELGMIVDSPMTYQAYLETEHAGAHQVLTPMMQTIGPRAMAAIAEESRR